MFRDCSWQCLGDQAVLRVKPELSTCNVCAPRSILFGLFIKQHSELIAEVPFITNFNRMKKMLNNKMIIFFHLHILQEVILCVGHI